MTISKHLYLLRHLYTCFGIKWIIRRAGYRFLLHSGWKRKSEPLVPWKNLPLEKFLNGPLPNESAEWFADLRERPFFFEMSRIAHSRPLLTAWDEGDRGPIVLTKRLKKGKLRYFSHAYLTSHFPPRWHVEPFANRAIPSDKHWSAIGDFDHGDIKFYWEPSRFGFVYAMVRAYGRTGDNNIPECFWQAVEDWRQHNRPQSGPNWNCGQEAAFRVMAWCFGLFGFINAEATTPERVMQLMQMIAISGERIEANIGYALSQNNNHGISGALGLWTIGTVFPELKKSTSWERKGRDLLERLGRELIYDDGSFTQHSVNYHRVMLHDYLWAIRLADIAGCPFSATLKKKVFQGVLWLYAMLDERTGRAPNYGHNDGALVLPLNNCGYRDFRPAIQAVHYLMRGERCFPPGPWDEDLLWLFGADALNAPINPPERRDLSAEVGGYYTLLSPQGRLFTRCANFRHRPGQADMLHVDLWWQGLNIALDAGTYSYNAPDPWNNALAGTACHNVVMVDSVDQMDRAGRFMWLPWLCGHKRVERKNPGASWGYWEGEHDGYARLSSPVIHRRGLLRLPGEYWLILDRLCGSAGHRYRLHWLLADFPFRWDEVLGQMVMETKRGPYAMQLLASAPPSVSIVRAEEHTARGWHSPYYYARHPAVSFAAEIDGEAAWFMTGFGPGKWRARYKGETLFIDTDSWRGEIDLRLTDHTSTALIGCLHLHAADGRRTDWKIA